MSSALDLQNPTLVDHTKGFTEQERYDAILVILRKAKDQPNLGKDDGFKRSVAKVIGAPFKTNKDRQHARGLLLRCRQILDNRSEWPTEAQMNSLVDNYRHAILVGRQARMVCKELDQLAR